MDINNATQFYNLMGRVGMGNRSGIFDFMRCIEDYAANCGGCEKKKNRQAIYNRCKAAYEALVMSFSVGDVATILAKVPDISVSFYREGGGLLRVISR